jgi:holliday junction DNA helicase RuvA
MYDYFEGRLEEKNPAYAIIDIHGIGYFLNISIHTFSRMPEEGQKVKLFSHLVVKEDALTLYGFSEEEERELFRLLISVSGVGANTARMILSSVSPSEVSQAIVTGNAPLLQSIKGIGSKTAQRIIIDLRDKLSKELIPHEKAGLLHNTKREEALSGLIILGFQKMVAEKALNKVLETRGEDLTVEELIRNALKIL